MIRAIVSVIVIFLLGSFYTNHTKRVSKAIVTDTSFCRDKNPNAIKVLGHSPHVPFAIIDKYGIRSATKACCVKWADTKKYGTV